MTRWTMRCHHGVFMLFYDGVLVRSSNHPAPLFEAVLTTMMVKGGIYA